MALGILGALAGLSGLPQGYMQGDDWLRRRQLQQLQLQQQAQQQQALRGAYAGLGPALTAQPPPMGGGQASPQIGGMGDLAQVPAMAGGTGLPALQRQVLNLEGNRDAAIGRAGELGPGQILPSTGRQYGYSPDQLLGDSGRQASARIVSDLYGKSGGDPAATLVGYNRGPGAMQKFQSAGDDPAAVNPALAPAYQKAVASEIQRKGSIMASMGAPAPAVQQSAQGAQQAAQALIPDFGRAQLAQAKEAIDKAMPDADPAVKFMSLSMIAKLLAPADQQIFRYLMAQNQNQFRQQLQEWKQEFQAGQGQANRDVKIEIAGAQIAGAGERQDKGIAAAGERQDKGIAAAETLAGKKGQLVSGGGGDVDAVAHAIANYQLAPLSGWTLRGPWGQAVTNRVLEINPDYRATDFEARKAGARSFATGRQADTVRSMSVAIDHLDTVDQLGRALQNGDARALNALKNTLQTQFGYEGPVDFNAAKMIVSDEVTKAVGGGVLSMTERVALADQLNAANSPEQLTGVSRTLKRLLAGQLGGLRRQYEQATGKGSEDFDKLLSPKAQEQLGGAAGATPDIGNASVDQLEQMLKSGNLSPEQLEQIQDRLGQLGIK